VRCRGNELCVGPCLGEVELSVLLLVSIDAMKSMTYVTEEVEQLFMSKIEFSLGGELDVFVDRISHTRRY
jgi:hypothetical protein